MKKVRIILGMMLLFQLSKGQDSLRKFEFGLTLVTVNSFNAHYYSPPDRPWLEWMNGAFFRYTKKRLGLRILASYSENTLMYTKPIAWADGPSGDSKNRDLRIGVGGQFSLLKHRDWFYTFLDLSYRNVFSTGHTFGGLVGVTDQFSRTSNGLDSFFGLGFKIKVLKHVYLSPETGYYLSCKFADETNTSLRSGQVLKQTYTQTDLNLALKLHLTVQL